MSSAARKWDEFDEENRPIGCHEHEPMRCTLADMATLKGEGATPAFIADCEKYFSIFVKPVTNDRKELICFHCGESLTGLGSFLLGRGGFTWGLIHGEGFCQNCKWPARCYHFAKNEAGEDLFTLRGFVLSYHPDGVEKRTEK